MSVSITAQTAFTVSYAVTLAVLNAEDSTHYLQKHQITKKPNVVPFQENVTGVRFLQVFQLQKK